MPADLTQIALKPWLALLYVALFSQWIGFFAWNAGLAMGGIARVSQINCCNPSSPLRCGGLQRRDHHAANPAVRRRRRGDGRDLDAHARQDLAVQARAVQARAGAIGAGSRAASVGGVLIDQLRVIGHQICPRLFRPYCAKQDPRGFQMIHLHAQLDDLAH
jgi:EamA-like transporter family.